jgi:hypothetical protein
LFVFCCSWYCRQCFWVLAWAALLGPAGVPMQLCWAFITHGRSGRHRHRRRCQVSNGFVRADAALEDRVCWGRVSKVLPLSVFLREYN